jgi:hypothetical protein
MLGGDYIFSMISPSEIRTEARSAFRRKAAKVGGSFGREPNLADTWPKERGTKKAHIFAVQPNQAEKTKGT